MKNLNLIRQVNLVIAMLMFNAQSIAQSPPELEEDFLLFLAGGADLDGQWRDPMTIVEMSDVQNDLFREELDWISERSEEELHSLYQEPNSNAPLKGDEHE